MSTNSYFLNNVKLNVKLVDRPYLLVWDKPTELEIEIICSTNNAQRISYRDNLLERIKKNERFLVLEHQVDCEINAIRKLVATSEKSIVFLEDLDLLITYLNIKSGDSAALFSHKLCTLRQLEKILWILLPSKLLPKNWPENRLLLVEDNS